MVICVHCDEAAVPPIYYDNDVDLLNPFCCHGCLTVHSVLHERGLESYYDIKKNTATFKRRSPVEHNSSQFKFLDENEFINDFTYVDQNGHRIMEFYLEGIHCLACLWLIEKIPEFVPAVYSSKLDLDRSVATVAIEKDGKFSQVAREFNHLGYRPHPLKRNQDTAELKIKEERTALLRIGLAGAAAGNIMLYSVSIYGGASGEYAKIFNALTLVFAFPVFTFSAFPFYTNAWNALRNRTLSIDIPISISLIIGFIMGVLNFYRGMTDNYFDGLTTLVFLLLMSRYFLKKIQEKGLSVSDLHFFYQTESVLRADIKTPDNFNEIHPRFIKSEDLLKILPGDFFPADGIILKGISYVNNSLLTGESAPVKVKALDKVFSGTQNLDQELIMRVENVPENSRMGRILKNVENGRAHRSHIVNLSHKISKYFTLTVIVLSLLLFISLYQTHDFRYALEGALTLLIVTCPCALALAVPLTFTRVLSQASQRGIIIKSDEVIEKLSKIKNVFIDKTGTITFGKLKVVDFILIKNPFIKVEDIIFNLEMKTRHPVAVALLEYVKETSLRKIPVDEYKELLGVGVSGKINNIFYEIKNNCIYEDGELIATFNVNDLVRTEAFGVLRKIMARGIEVKILSGDRKEVVEKIATEVHLPLSNALYGLDPEMKCNLIKSTPESMMVGDGANDATALTSAFVGVAVMGAMDISLRAADVYLTIPGLDSLDKLFVLSQETMKIIRRNLLLSLLYNTTSVCAVFAGVITPLFAAIIMPVSSLTVLFSTLYGTKELRHLWRS